MKKHEQSIKHLDYIKKKSNKNTQINNKNETNNKKRFHPRAKLAFFQISLYWKTDYQNASKKQ